ncbi:MAG: diguanylate cyclase, partial [Spartobacteria bacterium]|nr:diguanylate cyclase [Spartobacteria bacterium]
MPTISREAQLQEALRRYLDTYLVRRDRAGTLALFSPTSFLVGTAVDEVAYDRADLERIV